MFNSTKAVLVTGARSGGTFLSTCLSNHPEVYFLREEPFSRQGVYAELPNDEAILYQIYRQRLYKVNGFKTVFAELTSPRLESIFSWSPKIMYLLRRNVVKQALSGLIMHRVMKIHGEDTGALPIHSFEKVDQTVTFEIDPGDLIMASRAIKEKHKAYVEWVKEKADFCGLDQLTLYYEDLYTPAEKTGLVGITYIRQDQEDLIADFLGIDREFPLFSTMYKISNNSFGRIRNYEECYNAIKETELVEFWED